jgi:aminoglycoside 3-N-acetyltransferase
VTRDEGIAAGRLPVTGSRLRSALRALGAHPGDVVMVHTRLSSLGWVVGGSGTVVQALLDVLGPDGTLMAYAGWEDDSYDLAELPEAWQAAYRSELPPFDRRMSEAVKENGALPERIRTWPGAIRSRQPEASVVAVGARAEWITADHPWDDPYGVGSPLAKLVAVDGKVLMLGAPLDTITLLHHAEATARVQEKRRVVYEMPIREETGEVVWRTFHDINTASGAFPYERVAAEVAATPGMEAGDAEFAAIARQALAAGIGGTGTIGEAASHLFPAASLHAFAERWLEHRFGSPEYEPNGGGVDTAP